jgi:HK97 family phage prohead protease
MNRKDFTASTEVNGTTFRAVISTDSVDRDGDVMVPQGMNSKDYERNPVLLWQHDPTAPIGKCLSLKRGESAIEAEFELPHRPDGFEGNWRPDFVRELIKAGVLGAVSIGFMPMEGGERMATKGDVQRYGTDVRKVYSRWKLLEVSVVSVPANQDALIVAVQKGMIRQASVEALGLKAMPTALAVPKPARVVVSVDVPVMGRKEAERITVEELAKARGRLLL